MIHRHNKHFITVFIWLAGNETSGPQIETRRRHVEIERESKDLSHCIVSDLNGQELGDFAGMLLSN
jgi:hypothetical protein